MSVDFYEIVLLQYFHYYLLGKNDGVYLIGSIGLKFLHKLFKIFLGNSIKYVGNLIFHNFKLTQNSTLRNHPVIQRSFNQQTFHLISFLTYIFPNFNIN